MKIRPIYILAVLCFVFLALPGKAQIYLQEWTMPEAGCTFYYSQDTNQTTALLGTTGTGQTWDFSSLGHHDMSVFSFMTPAATGHGVDHPTANLAVWLEPDSVYFFADKGPSDMKVVGYSIDLLGDGNYTGIATNPQGKLMVYPATMGTTFTDTIGLDITIAASFVTGMDSARLKTSSINQHEFDAAGMVTTTMGTFDGLRKHEYRATIDSTWIRLFGSWILADNGTGEDTLYQWWTDSLRFLIAEAEVDSGLVNISVMDSATGCAPIVGLFDRTHSDIDVSLFPQPANGKLTMHIEQSGSKEIWVSDLFGKQVFHYEGSANQVNVNTRQLADGTYFYLIRGKGKSAQGKIIILH